MLEVTNDIDLDNETMSAISINAPLFGAKLDGLAMLYWLLLLTHKLSLVIRLNALKVLYTLMRKWLNLSAKKRLNAISPKVKAVLQLHIGLHYELENGVPLKLTASELIEQLQLTDAEEILSTLVEQVETLSDIFPEDAYFRDVRGDFLEASNEVSFLLSRLKHHDASH